MRKKMLAYFRNCSYKNFGKKVSTEYFPVDIELFLKDCDWLLGIDILLMSGSLVCRDVKELKKAIIHLEFLSKL